MGLFHLLHGMGAVALENWPAHNYACHQRFFVFGESHDRPSRSHAWLIGRIAQNMSGVYGLRPLADGRVADRRRRYARCTDKRAQVVRPRCKESLPWGLTEDVLIMVYVAGSHTDRPDVQQERDPQEDRTNVIVMRISKQWSEMVNTKRADVDARHQKERMAGMGSMEGMGALRLTRRTGALRCDTKADELGVDTKKCCIAC
ncbi:hypothetical protein C8Q77DRAFT_488573 [Trametes polyzona]|nr:hypothetical protein C8Q77DRAFT_488573 [Trametes polyzona]